MHGMYVCTPQLAGGNPLVGPNSFKTLGEGLRLVPLKRSSPLLIVPTPEGWKAEYTLASRMQIHESLTVLALLTRDEARTSNPWICSLMLYHLSYLSTHIYTYTYVHTQQLDIKTLYIYITVRHKNIGREGIRAACYIEITGTLCVYINIGHILLYLTKKSKLSYLLRGYQLFYRLIILLVL